MKDEEAAAAGTRVVFTALFLAALFLAASFQSQVQWFDNLPVHAQPGMWALISVSGMLVTGAAMALNSFRKPVISGTATELLFWIRAVEFLIWFMLYVFIVPYLGYLPSTILFCLALTRRLGYREKKWFVSAMLLAIVTVIVFRTFLQVRVPGGKLYELFPQPLSKFMLTYL